MVVLKRFLITLGLLLLTSLSAKAAPCPLSDYKFSGCIQGEVSGAGSPPEIQAIMKRLDFRLSTVLPWPKWLITAEAGMTGQKMVLGETFLEYRLDAVTTFKIGRFRPPFGNEHQTLPAKMDTIAGSLLYRFGNYGWPETLGLDSVSEFDYGLRADFIWPSLFAGLAPFISAALVTGNGRDVIPDIPSQGILRLGFASCLKLEDLRHEMVLGLSGAYGWNELSYKSGEYIPLGIPGDLTVNSAGAISITNFGVRSPVSLLGADISLRMNDLILKAEWMTRRIENFHSSGYSLTAISELEHYIPANLSLVGRWEAVVQGYADGLHAPGKPYSAATAGLKWRFAYWQLDINYVVLLYDFRLHAFPNSNIVMALLQVSF